MSKPDQNSKVTIEDLLRLKRAERPSPEFWSGFEQELRQKQLTALVQKRRWWHELPMRLNRRLYVPAGAAAIIAFTLVTVRFSTPTQIAQVTNTAPRIAAADPAVEMLAATVVAEPEQIRISSHEEPIALTSAPALTGASAPVVTSPRETESPAARSFPAALARLEPVESELAGAIMSSRLSAPARVQPAALAQPEVASVPNGNGSKYRLIARYADRSLSPEPTAPASIRERLARRLGDDLGDSISRIGVVGDRVSLRF